MPVVIAWAAARAYLLLAAAAAGLDGTSARTWVRWDSFQYLSIATSGYTLAGPDPNAGWMPGYPLVIRLASQLGAGPATAGMGLSAVCSLLMLAAIDGLVPAGCTAGRRFLVLMLAAFFPSFVYDHAVFPLSMASLMLAISVRLASGGRRTLGGLAGAGAAFTYTSGYLVGPAMGLWAVLSTGDETGLRSSVTRARRMFGPALLPLGGLVAVLVMQRIGIGRWDGLFRIQKAHGLTLTTPVQTLRPYVSLLTSPDRSLATAAWQVPVVGGLVGAVILGNVRRWRSRLASDQLLVVVVAWFSFTPLLLGPSISLFRAMAMLAPFVPPLMRSWPAALLWGLLALFLILGWPMCWLFLSGTLT